MSHGCEHDLVKCKYRDQEDHCMTTTDRVKISFVCYKFLLPGKGLNLHFTHGRSPKCGSSQTEV